MRIGLLTSIWGRAALTELVLEHYASMKVSGVELVPVAVVSPGDLDPCQLHPGWRYGGADNQPLSDKWNAGAKLMEVLGVDAVVITGSDDFLNAAYFEAVAELIESGADYVKLGGLHFYNAPSDELIYVEDCYMGLGRCLSRTLMNAVEWQPYFPGRRWGIDGWMDYVCRPHCMNSTAWINDSRSRGIFALDVKTDQNIKSFEDIERKYRGEYERGNSSDIACFLPEVDLSSLHGQSHAETAEAIGGAGRDALRKAAASDRESITAVAIDQEVSDRG